MRKISIHTRSRNFRIHFDAIRGEAVGICHRSSAGVLDHIWNNIPQLHICTFLPSGDVPRLDCQTKGQ
jgi:hypothetical protein